jgi:hypothetical protein
MTDHPIIPTHALVHEWIMESNSPDYELNIATQAARWGADQELEACCEWLKAAIASPSWVKDLRAARRPKLPTLKEQALALLDTAQGSDDACNSWNFDIIRRTLETLPND